MHAQTLLRHSLYENALGPTNLRAGLLAGTTEMEEAEGFIARTFSALGISAALNWEMGVYILEYSLPPSAGRRNESDSGRKAETHSRNTSGKA